MNWSYWHSVKQWHPGNKPNHDSNIFTCIHLNLSLHGTLHNNGSATTTFIVRTISIQHLTLWILIWIAGFSLESILMRASTSTTDPWPDWSKAACEHIENMSYFFMCSCVQITPCSSFHFAACYVRDYIEWQQKGHCMRHHQILGSDCDVMEHRSHSEKSKTDHVDAVEKWAFYLFSISHVLTDMWNECYCKGERQENFEFQHLLKHVLVQNIISNH